MEKPVIAFDFDDTLVATTRGFVDWYNKTYNTFIHYEDINADISTFLHIDREAELKLWSEYFASDFFLALPPMNHAVEALRALHTNFTLVLVTNREHEFKSSLDAWIQKYAPGCFSKIIFARDFPEGKRPKGEVIKPLGAICLVDDEPENLLSARESGVRAIVFDAPWNQKLTTIERVSSFDQLLTLLTP